MKFSKKYPYLEKLEQVEEIKTPIVSDKKSYQAMTPLPQIIVVLP